MNEEELKNLLHLRMGLGLYKLSVQDIKDNICHINSYADGHFFYQNDCHGKFLFAGTVPEEEFSKHILFPVEIE